MPMPEAPDLAILSLAQIAQSVADKHLPPVDQWNPSYCGNSEMRIASDGTWYHQSTPITRANMVKLFSTVLRREADGRYVLVTPVEKLDIVVDDAPFIAVELKTEGEGKSRSLAFRLNSDDLIIASAEHPIRFAERDGEPRPYLMVRGGMEALIARPVYYELANLALEEGSEPVGLWSSGAFFTMAPA
jgi:uncharacterized protein